MTASFFPASLWAPLRDEFARWHDAGMTLQLWLRDDDAIEVTPQLERLIALAQRFQAPVLLASIPMLATPALASRVREAPLLQPCQHGFRHQNHVKEAMKAAITGSSVMKAAEFGLHRSADVMMAELAQGRARLSEVFGDMAIPVFVPPWNRIDPALAARLPQLGFKGLSTFRNFKLPAMPGFRVFNSDLDIIDWKRGRIGHAPEKLVAGLLDLLQEKRLGNKQPFHTLGILMHHLVHDATAWDFMDWVLENMLADPAVTIVSPAQLFCVAQPTA